MASNKAYDPSKSTLALGGLTVSGYAPDTKVVISRTNGVSTPTVGVDGDISVNIDPRKVGTLTFSLMHNSDFNDLVYTWLKTVETTGNPYLPVYFEDPSGQMIDTVGWFETQGDYTNAQETSTLDWTLGIANATLRPVETNGILGAIEAFSGVSNLV
jgi:hypothetical protein